MAQQVYSTMTMGAAQPAKVVLGGVTGTGTFAAGAAPVMAAAPVLAAAPITASAAVTYANLCGSASYPAPVTYANALAPTAASYTYGAAPALAPTAASTYASYSSAPTTVAFADPPQQYTYPTAAVAQQVVAYSPTSVQAAWDNHFEAFGKQDLEKILLDYDETSVVRVYNTSDAKKVEFFGIAGVRNLFEKLFKDLADLATLDAPNVDVDETGKQVFLIWNCPGCGFDSCTDTFIFGTDFKIKRQNIVVTKGDVTKSKTDVTKTKTKKVVNKRAGCC